MKSYLKYEYDNAVERREYGPVTATLMILFWAVTGLVITYAVVNT